MQELLELLETGKLKLEQLLQLSEQKRRAIIENKREEVAELSQQELELTAALQSWELKRQDSTSEQTLKELASENGHNRQLLQLREELIHLTQKLASSNQQNAQLLNAALAYTEYALSLFQFEDHAYGQKEQGKVSFLDRKV